MSERFKETPFLHRVFGVVTTAALAACAVGERMGFVTPPPEETRTNPTEVVPPIPYLVDIEKFLPVEGSSSDSRLTSEITVNLGDGLWGTYIVGRQELGIIKGLKLLSESDVDEKVKSSIEEIAKVSRIKNPKYSFLEVEGDMSRSLMPFVWTLDSEGKVAERWMVWSMGEGGVITSPNSENSDSLVFVGLSKLVLPDRNGVVIGPTRGSTVTPFIVFVFNTGWFIKDLPNVEEGDYYIPINMDIFTKLQEFLTK